MGTELERCCCCDEPTGRAGRADDSLYAADGTGPYRPECWDELPRLATLPRPSPPAEVVERALRALIGYIEHGPVDPDSDEVFLTTQAKEEHALDLGHAALKALSSPQPSAEPENELFCGACDDFTLPDKGNNRRCRRCGSLHTEVKRSERAQPSAQGEVVEAMRPRVVCFCGSSKFVDVMAVEAWNAEKQGKISLSLHLLPSWYTECEDHLAEHEGVAEQMDELHLCKIEMADEVRVINVGGYIGDSTRREIAHATKLGKPISYFEEAALEPGGGEGGPK